MTAPDYRAFISYSHADEKLASWLHRALEAYRIPGHIVRERRLAFRRLVPIFRDREELASSENLSTTITTALRASDHLIVICSPAAAQPRWVNEEIRQFRALRADGRVLCLLAGDPADSFPQEAGASEPLAADVRPHADGKRGALLKIVAGLLGVGFDELRQRETARRQRRLVAISMASVTGMAVAIGLAAFAFIAERDATEAERKANAEARTAERTLEFFTALLRESDPARAQGADVRVRDVLDKGAPRISRELADEPKVSASLQETIGLVYESLGLYDQAQTMLEGSLETRRGLFGPNHPEVATSQRSLAKTLWRKGRYSEAEALLRSSLDIRKREDPVDARSLADTLHALALVFAGRGDLKAAEANLREAIALLRSLPAPPLTTLANAVGELAVERYMQNDMKEAAALGREALALYEQAGVRDSLDVARLELNLAVFLEQEADYVAAEKAYEDGLTHYRKVLGDQHPEVARNVNNFATFQFEQGNVAEAEALAREAVYIYRASLSNDNPDLAPALDTLATVLNAKGSFEDAEALAREAVAIMSSVTGEHVYLAFEWTTLADALVGQHEYAEAEELYRRAIETNEKELPPDAIDRAYPLVGLGVLLTMQRDTEAEVTLTEAVRLRRAGLPAGHWRIAEAEAELGDCLLRLGRPDEGNVLLARAKPILEARLHR